MTSIHFRLEFRSQYGQQFFIVGNIPQLGNGNKANAAAMQYSDGGFWEFNLELDEKQTTVISYQYILRNADGFETMEGDRDRNIDLKQLKSKALQVLDTWNYMGEYENAFYTQPFQDTLLAVPQKQTKPKPSKDCTHIFKVKAPLISQGQTLCLLGNINALGNWTEANAIPLQRDGKYFSVSVDLEDAFFPVLYKYGVWDLEKNIFVKYESGENRILISGSSKKHLVLLHDGFAQVPNNSFKGTGVAIPVFGLRTQNGLGVGEFSDIKMLVDWGKKVGLKLIQLLPLNDTTATNTWLDSYPYSAISAFALHPLFINLKNVAGEKYASEVQPYYFEKEKLNDLPEIDYEAVMQVKTAGLKDLFQSMKNDLDSDKSFKIFYQENQHWLLPYAAFCYLRDSYKTADFSQWKKNGQYNDKAISSLASKGKSAEEIKYHFFVQYHLHLQLKDAVDYAHKNGIVMKGDLPIGIYRYSADAWVSPSLYNMDAQAGAPPDGFAVKGQNWGFPTYNWKKMQEDGFAWWQQRFEQLGRYFDAFRIDHILGFFRIWSIPMHAVEGIMGRFVPCIPVYQNEFAEQGIYFDKNRYCQPFITDEVVGNFFGEKYNWIKDNFLNDAGFGSYQLKENVNTQQKVEAWFAQNSDVDDWIKFKLYDLISNVILFEDGEIENAYHFRIGMEATTTFQYLDGDTQQKLSALFVNYFFRRQDDFWKQQAMQKLPALKASTNMLICGEDLGMVPNCVPGVMKDLGLLSLEIQRMPKDNGRKFFHPADAPYLSVVTPSTHDMSTIRGWWQEDQNNTQQFYNNELGQNGGAPFYCEPWINQTIVVQHLYSPAMWSIFQLQDLLGMDGNLRRQNPDDERINIPANPHHYWRFRMNITLEQLMNAKDFNQNLEGLVKQAGR